MGVLTALNMLESRERIEQIDCQAKQPSQAACVSGLRCCGASDAACGHKTKDIIPLIAWRREGEAQNE